MLLITTDPGFRPDAESVAPEALMNITACESHPPRPCPFFLPEREGGEVCVVWYVIISLYMNRKEKYNNSHPIVALFITTLSSTRKVSHHARHHR